MNIVLSGLIVVLFIINLIQSQKIKVLAKGQSETNKALNETRDLVAKHQKQLKHL